MRHRDWNAYSVLARDRMSIKGDAAGCMYVPSHTHPPVYVCICVPPVVHQVLRSEAHALQREANLQLDIIFLVPSGSQRMSASLGEDLAATTMTSTRTYPHPLSLRFTGNECTIFQRPMECIVFCAIAAAGTPSVLIMLLRPYGWKDLCFGSSASEKAGSK